MKLIRPTPATLKELSVYHTEDYLQFVLNPGKAGTSEPHEFGLEEVRLDRSTVMMVDL